MPYAFSRKFFNIEARALQWSVDPQRALELDAAADERTAKAHKTFLSEVGHYSNDFFFAESLLPKKAFCMAQ